MNYFDNYERNRTASLLGLRAFPRSFGMIAGAITLLSMQNPFIAILISLLVWFITFLIKSTLPPRIIDTNLWSCCSIPVNTIGAYPIRWALYVIMVIIAIVIGAPFISSLLVMGALLVYDIIIVFTYGA